MFRSQVAAIESERAAKLLELHALDQVIAHAYPSVRPDAAGSVLAWAGSYGKRSDLKRFVLRIP